MATIAECQIVKTLIGEIKWIVADETRAFDKYFDMPIVNIEFTVEQLRAFYVWRRGIDGSTRRTVVHEKLAETLTVLAEHGESPEKLASWLILVSDTDTSNYDSRKQWEKYFKFVFNDVSAHTNKDIISLAHSYMTLVDSPYSEFYKLCVQSESQWKNLSQNRSDFDDYLWREYFSEFDMSPVGFARLYYATMLQRTWWNREGASLAADLKEEMYADLVNLRSQNNETFNWNDTHPIDLVFGMADLD